ncbi:MAG: hypothetical protein KHW84_11955 [Enterobacter cloacae]|nr:hypothetical protein [Enterobacter cloacae]
MNIYSPSKINIKSNTEVNVDTPWAVEKKLNVTGFVLNSVSMTGLALSLTGMTIGITTTKIENDPVKIAYNNGFSYKAGTVNATNY